MITVCCCCKKDMGDKEPFENTAVTHGICPDCTVKWYPRVAVLSVVTPEIANLGAISNPNKEIYCKRHGYKYFKAFRNSLDRANENFLPYWHKIFMLDHFLSDYKNLDWLFWTDSDVLIMDMTQSLEDRFLKEAGDAMLLIADEGTPPTVHLNSGNMLFRVCDESRAFIKEVLSGFEQYKMHPLAEQLMINRIYGEGKYKIKVLPARAINSTVWSYQPGDFLVHVQRIISGKKKPKELWMKEFAAKMHCPPIVGACSRCGRPMYRADGGSTPPGPGIACPDCLVNLSRSFHGK